MYNYLIFFFFFRFLNQKIANLTNSGGLELFKKCKHQDEIWKCMLPEYIIEEIDFPVFIINSQDDSEAMRSQYGVKCIIDDPEDCSDDDKAKIAQFRQRFLEIIDFAIKNKSNWGFWLRTCFDHVYQSTKAWYSEEYNVFNSRLERWYSLKFALNFWYNGGNIRNTEDSTFIDEYDWENNPYCKFTKNKGIGESDIGDFYQALFFMLLALLLYWYALAKCSECLLKKEESEIEIELVEK